MTERDAQVPQSDSPTSCGCGPGGCGPIDRRTFIQIAGAATVAASGAVPALAGPFTPQDTADHFVPADKKLTPEWLAQLFARGSAEWFEGKDLETIGMPVGGICAGQVYLSGDGRLIYWDVFNQNINTGYGAINYKVGRRPTEVVQRGRDFIEAPALEQGFALKVKQGGKTSARKLDASGFSGVRFRGEYPIGRVEYRAKDFPLAIDLEAYSPFIPLATEDSALPATILEYTVRNTSGAAAEVELHGWLGNAVHHYSAGQYGDRLRRTKRAIPGTGTMQCGAELVPRPEETPSRPPIVFADFEGEDYGEWKVEGEAFGKQPARGTLAEQQHVSGFEGKGLINTYLGMDGPRGRLVSPRFRIERRWISFLIGGGKHDGKACINLIVDGRIARTATGRNSERLEPHNWDVARFEGKRAHLEILDQVSTAWGHINVDQIEFRDEPMQRMPGELRLQPDHGTMAIGTLDEEGGVFFGNAHAPGEGEETGPGYRFELAPGAQRTLRFALAWHMPNMYRGTELVGNYYARRFRSAAAVIRYISRHRERLAAETRRWRDTWYDSTLPYWLLDRLHSTAANLATTTCQWWRGGRFWAWEGGGCCSGTCGHVWNYAHTLARLFPRLERSAREMQDFAPGVGFEAETGKIAFRGQGDFWAGDAQGGYLLKALREHQTSTDSRFLERNWRQIKKALEFLISEDGDADGLLEGSQHNTYDINYHGPNTMVGSLYLGALLAGEAMAREVGDEPFAQRCRAIFESGRKLTMERLFNGEYFIQIVDLEKFPKHQYGDGCLADQLFGQGWAHQVGLGYLYPREAVRSALQAIWKYDWAPDVGPQNEKHAPERWFAYPGEAGLFTCTWPRSKHLGRESTRYRDEIWTGIEYQVAGHMAWEGMVTEALAICRGVHERYHPAKHNPWNEIECGDHYARALASWGVLIGLAGFEYDGPRRHIGFAPRMTPEHFRAAFTGAEGWGSFEQKREGRNQVHRLGLHWGELRLRSLAFELPSGVRAGRVTARAAGHEVALAHAQEGLRVSLALAEELELKAGQTLEVLIEA